MKTVRRLIFGEGELAVCGDAAVTLGSRSWTPDESRAYIKFNLSFAFPNVSNYGDGIHAGVIGRSYQSMYAGCVDSNHSMASYGAEADAIAGAVMGVEFPQTPDGGWKTAAERKAAPYITGVAALWLLAAPTEKWVDRYAAKKKVRVSMEVLYSVAHSGFAVKAEGRIKNDEVGIEGALTPAEFLEAGWEYVPMANLLTPKEFAAVEKDSQEIIKIAEGHAKDSLLRTRNWKAKRMIGGSLMGPGLVGSWQGRDVYFLQGGIDGTVHYPGMGLVEMGAEPRAGLETMLAEDEDAGEIERGLEEVGAELKLLKETISRDISNS